MTFLIQQSSKKTKLSEIRNIATAVQDKVLSTFNQLSMFG